MYGYIDILRLLLEYNKLITQCDLLDYESLIQISIEYYYNEIEEYLNNIKKIKEEEDAEEDVGEDLEDLDIEEDTEEEEENKILDSISCGCNCDGCTDCDYGQCKTCEDCVCKNSNYYTRPTKYYTNHNSSDYGYLVEWTTRLAEPTVFLTREELINSFTDKNGKFRNISKSQHVYDFFTGKADICLGRSLCIDACWGEGSKTIVSRILIK